MSIVVGFIFAIPARIPMMKNRAKDSVSFRKMLRNSLSILCFLFVFSFLNFGGVVGAKMPSVILPLCDGDCPGTFYVFRDDPQRDTLFMLEMWLHHMMPPFMVSDTNCFTGDVLVCAETTQKLQNYAKHSDWNYVMSFIVSLIPAYSCGVYVWQITRDNRKEKAKSPG